MFEVGAELIFSAAHHIPGYPGDCARVHGHNFRVCVRAKVQKTDHLGMALDFRSLKSALKEIIAPWDHQDLNRLEDFKNRPSTAEQIAQLTFERLKHQLKDTRAKITEVKVWENDCYWAAYSEEGER